MTKLSYAITVNDEFEELKTLLNKIFNVIENDDEIIILQDEYTEDKKYNWNKVYNYVMTNFTLNNKVKFKYNSIPLNNNFSNFKNIMIDMCSNEWIVHFDADEYPNQILLNNVKKIININHNIDIYYVPRINIVNGITQEYIEKMHWNVNSQNWINFPDYQQRIWRNITSVRWGGKVHERLYSKMDYPVTQSYLPAEEMYSYYHIKSFDKQQKQNEYYSTLM